jgi:DNA-binding transcriptional ArsR family regulator
MSSPKQLAFEQFALVARALGSAHRLELLDTLAQSERSVERLAQAAGLTINNTSQHLQQLRRAGLVASRKVGTQVIYSLADPEAITLIRTLWRVTERNVAELERVVQRYYRDRDSLEPVSRDELQARLRAGAVIVLDVRPAYDAIDVLRPKGFRARRLLGGYLEWMAAGLPVERNHAVSGSGRGEQTD